ncbi:hypothetical protein [Streptomyces canus]|uniref:hypothetical protein n=1 Tax=Streptomyces canus TaxID=58343 RepID=UPI003863C247|nr:hypothetical protein OH824_22055 [Streptomyces canus]
MSQNYASLICSVASALLVLVAIEVATTLKNMGEENLKLRKLFASEIKESAEAQRSAIEISPPRRHHVNSRVRIYLRLRLRTRRMLQVLYLCWLTVFALCQTLIAYTLIYSAEAHPEPSNSAAGLLCAGTVFAILSTLFGFALRVRAMEEVRKWEQRIEMAQQLNMRPAEMTAMMRSWARHNNTDWQ